MVGGTPQMASMSQAMVASGLPAGMVAKATLQGSGIPETDLQPGARVRVSKSLAARPQLIGKTAVVESASAGGDVLIAFDDPALGGMKLNLKPQHLEPC